MVPSSSQTLSDCLFSATPLTVCKSKSCLYTLRLLNPEKRVKVSLNLIMKKSFKTFCNYQNICVGMIRSIWSICID